MYFNDHALSFNRQEKLRRVWEPTYTVVYRELKDEAGAAISASSDTTQVALRS